MLIDTGRIRTGTADESQAHGAAVSNQQRIAYLRASVKNHPIGFCQRY